MRQKQQGLTLIGFVFVLAAVLFVAYIGMQLFPVYQEYYSVSQAMEQLKNEPGISEQSPQQVRNALFKRFYISYVESVTQKDVEIKPKDNYSVRVAYEVRKELLGNLDVVAKFDKSVQLRGGG